MIGTHLLHDLFVYNNEIPLLFNSVAFLCLFSIFYTIYIFVSKTEDQKVIWSLIFSLFFYYKCSGHFFILLIISILINFYLAKSIYKVREDKRHSTFLLIVAVVANLGILFYFKYANFFIQSTNDLFGSGLQSLQVFLPIGISFFTFQTMSYVIDVYRGRLEPEYDLLEFSFFVSFFPQLVAGPIVRATDFMPQIRQPKVLDRDKLSRAFMLIIGGLIKKAVISDYISVNFVDRVFDNPTLYSGFENLIAIYGYGLQIYCDFSGYSDIAIGLALLLGFKLPDNFNKPYQSASLTEFWRRWHISLSSWLRDYLYIPLGGNRKGTLRTYINLMITMLLGGLWHGASWKFVIWGGMHGALLAIERLIEPLTNKLNFGEFRGFPIKRIIGVLFTFHFVLFCWIYFRADSLEKAQQLLHQVFSGIEWNLALEVISGYKKVFLVMLFGFVIHFIPRKFEMRWRIFFADSPILVKSFALAFSIWVLIQIASADVVPFIYFQF